MFKYSLRGVNLNLQVRDTFIFYPFPVKVSEGRVCFYIFESIRQNLMTLPQKRIFSKKGFLLGLDVLLCNIVCCHRILGIDVVRISLIA